MEEKTRKSNLGYENQKVLFWIRKPESLMLDEKKPERLILDKKNRTVLSWIRKPESLELKR